MNLMCGQWEAYCKICLLWEFLGMHKALCYYKSLSFVSKFRPDITNSQIICSCSYIHLHMVQAKTQYPYTQQWLDSQSILGLVCPDKYSAAST